MLTIFIIGLFLGAVAGFLAGLLGIGGGLVVVPVLSAVLYDLGIVEAKPAFLIAVATSLASIIVTSFSSALSHHRHHNIDWSLAGWITVGVSIGAALSSLLSGVFSVEVLKMVFAGTVTFVAVRMLFAAPPNPNEGVKPPNKWLIVPPSTVIGTLSGLIGIGGGALVVPLLARLNVGLKRAIGISTVASTCIAVMATASYIITGWGQYALSDWFLGYVYLPALAGIIITSPFFTPLGAKAVQRLPVKVLKRLFAAAMLVIAAKIVLF